MAVPTDNTMKANISIAINARDVIANQMCITIREVLGIAKNTFGDGTAHYKTFNGSEISTQQQHNGIVAAKRTVYIGLDELTTDATFKLKVFDGNDWVFYFSQTEGGDAGAKTVTASVEPNN